MRLGRLRLWRNEIESKDHERRGMSLAPVDLPGRSRSPVQRVSFSDSAVTAESISEAALDPDARPRSRSTWSLEHKDPRLNPDLPTLPERATSRSRLALRRVASAKATATPRNLDINAALDATLLLTPARPLVPQHGATALADVKLGEVETEMGEHKGSTDEASSITDEASMTDEASTSVVTQPEPAPVVRLTAKQRSIAADWERKIANQQQQATNQSIQLPARQRGPVCEGEPVHQGPARALQSFEDWA